MDWLGGSLAGRHILLVHSTWWMTEHLHLGLTNCNFMICHNSCMGSLAPNRPLIVNLNFGARTFQLLAFWRAPVFLKIWLFSRPSHLYLCVCSNSWPLCKYPVQGPLYAYKDPPMKEYWPGCHDLYKVFESWTGLLFCFGLYPAQVTHAHMCSVHL